MQNYTYSDELYHYGVIGMKWGVRKDPQKAYSKSTEHIKKLESKAAKANSKKSKINKLEKTAQKNRLKAAKVARKNTRALFRMNDTKAARKMSKYNLKAARAENKISKINSDADKKYRKAEKFYKKMEKTFKDIPVSSLNQADVAFAKEYANTIAEREKMRSISRY